MKDDRQGLAGAQGDGTSVLGDRHIKARARIGRGAAGRLGSSAADSPAAAQDQRCQHQNEYGLHLKRNAHRGIRVTHQWL